MVSQTETQTRQTVQSEVTRLREDLRLRDQLV